MEFKTFFDYDNIECITVDDAKLEHPELDWEKVEARFAFPRGGRTDENGIRIGGVNIIAVADLMLCVRLHRENLGIEEVNYFEVAHCSVCRRVLLPDDEAYSDAKTGNCLCTDHARFSETDDMYHKVIF